MTLPPDHGITSPLGVSRRKFLTGSAAVGGLLAAAAVPSLTEPSRTASAATTAPAGSAGVIDATAFGVKAGGADQAANINRAMAAAAAINGSVLLPAGDIVINTPINFSASFSGFGPNGTRIKPGNGFKGNYLIDMNAGKVPLLAITDLKIDLGFGKATAFGSSANMSGPGQPLFENIYFVNSNSSIYAVSGSTPTAVDGMFTGGTFLHCRWENVAHWANIGVQQDDVTFVGCRFMNVPGNAPSQPPLNLEGCNTTFTDSFMYTVKSASTAKDRPVITVGSSVASFRGLFIETAADSNFTHLFYTLNPNFHLAIDTVRQGMKLNNFVALVRANLGATTLANSTISVRNLLTYHDTEPYTAFEVHSSGASNGQSTTLSFEGVDSMANLIAFAPGSSSNTGRVNLVGARRNAFYSHYVTSAAGANRFTPMPGP